MHALLKEISIIPGVTGSCVFDKSAGPVCHEMQREISREMLETVGIHLLRLLQMGRMIDLQADAVHFHFDKASVVGLPMESGTVLLIFCEPQANCSLVATTAAMLVADLRDEMARGGKRAGAQSPPTAVASPSSDEPINDSQLLARLDAIQGALAAAIGPMAGIIMHDYILKWRQAGPATATRLPELTAMLVAEIPDPRLSADFNLKIDQLQ